MGAAKTAQFSCRFEEVEYSPLHQACDRCERQAPLCWQAERHALDLDVDRVGLLLVRVGVYRCEPCRHYFRARPPFLRPDAVYTNRVIAAAIDAVFRDGMAISRVPDRLARDFHLRPSEASVRLWCRTFAPGQRFETDYQAWVRASFSGVLCVDEVYQGRRLALLLAVDPRAPDGDRLVGYRLLDRGYVDQADAEAFLTRLREQGLCPEQVITDGSNIYPEMLAKVWPKAAHQLCLFHETRTVLRKAMRVVDQVRRELPKLPAVSKVTGPLLRRVDPNRPTDGDRDARIALAKRLHQQGLGMRVIARQLGHSRTTIKTWVRGEVLPREERDASQMAVETLTRGGSLPPPPTGWRDWNQVLTAKETLSKSRWLVLARKERLLEPEAKVLAEALALPCAEPLRVAHAFAQAWYAIWESAPGERRSRDEAHARFVALREDARARTQPALVRIQRQMKDERFAKLSPYLTRPDWEATNNGAERTGRLFRHLQAPHYRMRSRASIKTLLEARAVQKMEAGSVTPAQAGRSGRGRPPKNQATATA